MISKEKPQIRKTAGRRSLTNSSQAGCFLCRRLHDGPLIGYNKAKFIQEWNGHANTYCGSGSDFDYHISICADAAYATNSLCDRSDYALCLCYCPFEPLLPGIRARSILELIRARSILEF